MIDKTVLIDEIGKIEQKKDGSYIVTKNNMPYHIPCNKEYRQEYEAVSEYIKENNMEINPYVEEEYGVINKKSENYIRTKRDMLLKEADILLLKYNEQVELKIIEKNMEYYTAILRYKQNLRDITMQIDFPENVTFPEMPQMLI